MTSKELKNKKEEMFSTGCGAEEPAVVESYFHESAQSLLQAVERDDPDAIIEAKELFNEFFHPFQKRSPELGDGFERDSAEEIQLIFSRRKGQARDELEIDRLERLVGRYRSVRSAYEGLFRSFAEYPLEGLWEKWNEVDLGELIGDVGRGKAVKAEGAGASISHPIEAALSLRAAHSTDELKGFLGFPGWLWTGETPAEDTPMAVLEFPSPKQLMEMFAEIGKKADREGLLALEDDIDEIGPEIPLLGKALQLIVEGTDPKLVEKMIDNHFVRVDRRLGELEEIVKEALRSVHEGDNPSITAARGNLAPLSTIISWDTHLEYHHRKSRQQALRSSDDEAEFGFDASELDFGKDGDTDEGFEPEQESEPDAYAEFVSILSHFGRDKRRGKEYGTTGIEEEPKHPHIYEALVEIIKSSNESVTALEDQVALLFARLREEAFYAHSLLKEGTLHIQDGGKPGKLRKRANEVLLPGWKKELPESLLRFSGFVTEHHSRPAPIYRALERMFGELSTYILDGDTAEGELRGAMEEDARRLCRACGESSKSGGSGDSNGSVGGIGDCSGLTELLYAPARVEGLLSERKQRCDTRIAQEHKVEQRLLESMEKMLQRATREYAQRHPKVENIDSFVEKEKLEAFSLELIKLYVQRKKGELEEQERSRKESKRELEKKSRDLLGYNLAEELDESQQSFEVEMALLLFPYSREKLNSYVSAHFTEETERSILGGYLFSFDRIAGLKDKDVQKVLREVDFSVLALAIKDAPQEVGSKIFRNMSHKAGSMLKEEIEYLGSVSPKRSRTAQREISGIMQQLQDNGEIRLPEG